MEDMELKMRSLLRKWLEFRLLALLNFEMLTISSSQRRSILAKVRFEDEDNKSRTSDIIEIG